MYKHLLMILLIPGIGAYALLMAYVQKGILSPERATTIFLLALGILSAVGAIRAVLSWRARENESIEKLERSIPKVTSARAGAVGELVFEARSGDDILRVGLPTGSKVVTMERGSLYLVELPFSDPKYVSRLARAFGYQGEVTE